MPFDIRSLISDTRVKIQNIRPGLLAQGQTMLAAKGRGQILGELMSRAKTLRLSGPAAPPSNQAANYASTAGFTTGGGGYRAGQGQGAPPVAAASGFRLPT